MRNSFSFNKSIAMIREAMSARAGVCVPWDSNCVEIGIARAISDGARREDILIVNTRGTVGGRNNVRVYLKDRRCFFYTV